MLNFTIDTYDIKTEPDRNQDMSIPFETLPSLPVPFFLAQCVAHKHEILICGGFQNNECYSYHTIKEQYKRICSYPKGMIFSGHTIVKRVDAKNENAVTLLSFGGYPKHTLVMKYASVWDTNNKPTVRKIEQRKNSNQWLPLTDNLNNPIWIGRNNDNYFGMRAVIGGSNNHLLFITYRPNNIDVFNLDTLQYVKHYILPTESDLISSHCFVSKSKDQKSTMILFSEKTGLSIEYNENNNTFSYEKLLTCIAYKQYNRYAYVSIDDFIFFFGGWNEKSHFSNGIYKFSLKDKKWTKLERILSVSLRDCTGVINGDGTHVHIIGGSNGLAATSTHLRIKISDLLTKETEAERQWIVEEEKAREIEKQNEIIEREIKQIKTNSKYIEENTFEALKLKVNLAFSKKKKKKKWKLQVILYKIEMIIDSWLRLLSIRIGWIRDFDKIVLRYILVSVIFLPDDNVKNVKFSPDGTKIVAYSMDATIQQWDVISGYNIQMWRGNIGYSGLIQFSPDGKTIAACLSDCSIQLLDVHSGKELMRLRGHPKRISSIQFSPNGKILVSGSSDTTFRIWDVNSGNELRRLAGHLDSITNINFSPDSNFIVTASDAVRIWNITSYTLVRTCTGTKGTVTDAQFSPDGLCIVSCWADHKIRIFDVASGTQIKILEGHSGVINGMTILSDYQTIVSCSYDKTIRLWDMHLGIEIQTLKGYLCNVNGIYMSTDGNTIVSCNEDKLIRVWEAF
ncbi:WD-40 repeat-containing protein [Reticulomyxa filosa]|uniref:WD-40 repeat-containing protein n=1 Tax=Reticulomyxa filosa TaxID=46433 RepID=X6NCY0_RETFI|nr:WD-40 repeat-containing protein [Reticulomyxa filosa]|eukprot:ETO23821.1 WD-40 repeat-containing protein [Reticulomyxa filosa]